MWMLRPWFAPPKLEIPIPTEIQEQLGSGAEVLASYINTLAESGPEDPANHPPPLPQLCRICERQIPPWWFERHSEFCLAEHKAEMEVQACQERLIEHRSAIVKVLDALEARRTRQVSGGEQLTAPVPPAEYKGLLINETPTPNSSSGASTPGTPPSRSRDRNSTGFGHVRARSFAVRRPRARMVELLLDLCDTALEISTPAIKDSSAQAPGEFRTQTPQSESRIQQVWQWQSPVVSEDEPGLSLLCIDSGRIALAKTDAVVRHQRVIEYAERVRVETSVKVQDYIDDCIRTACDLALNNVGEFEEEEPTPAREEGVFSGSFDGPSSLAMALREEEARQGRLASSTAVSTRSSSPKECPTPRSHMGSMSLLGQPRDSRRHSLFFDSDAGESDGSMRSSSIMSRPDRNDSPVSEFGDLRRAVNRRSMILPGSTSPRRQESPSRPGQQPSSPLRISKPRAFPGNIEGLQSPTVSPFLPSSEFNSPVIGHHHQHHHHRRQSSVADAIRFPPPSPRLSSVGASVGAPQARAVPPSIKDFEIVKPISKGAFGSVYLSKKKSTGDYFAIKVLKKADMVAKNQVTNVKAERAIMMFQGESDFVAKLYWTFSSKDYLYLVMEYLNGGDCASLIKVLGGLPEDWAKKYLGEVILGVEHLHSRGIVHRDLKPDNLLIDQKGHLKLTDFGLSRMGLIGRQKRVLNGAANESAPDLLKTGPFVARSSSLTSSRSASFDFQGHHSPGSTPQIEPDLASNLAQPSYFNLSKDKPSYSHESRRTSGHRSDSNGSESLHSLFQSFSLDEPRSHRRSMEELEAEHSPELGSFHKTFNNSTADQHNRDREAISLASMLPPPPLTLFDPDDTNRRFVGTPDYLAPETVSGVGQDEMSDWWSVGCILFEFLFGYPPFHDETPDKVFENILARKISWPSDEDVEVSPSAKDLMNKLLCIDPRERLGANNDEKLPSGGAEIRAHPWFDGFGWETLLKDEAQFIPAPENPEDTEYFDTRGATLQAFAEEMEDQISSPPHAVTPGADYVDRPHDALSRVRSQVNSMKRGLMPLHIPPHVRSEKTRRLSEPVQADDFGNFSFKNLPVLEKANKDVIQKLRAEAMTAQSKTTSVISPGHQTVPTSLSPALEGSPMLPMPIKRTLSNAKSGNRPASPSVNQAAASPSRASQPSSPLLVSFVAGQNTEARRKTSSTSSSLSHQSASSLQPGSFFEGPRTTSVQKATTSAAGSPIKARGVPPPPLALSPQKLNPITRQSSNPASRARSQTVGSQEGSPSAIDIFSQHKRRSQVFDMSPSSSDNEGDKANALLRVQRRRQSSRRMSAINLLDGPVFRPLDVLICEDHPVSRMVMEKLLEKLRCRTITVSNGAEAMRYACSEIKFDIIMMEFKLPQINGADVARMIRDTKNINAQTPIIAITGYLKELQAPHYFDALIEKPPTTSKLTEVISNLCCWKPAVPGQSLYSSYPTPSGLRQESLRSDDSPTSGSSGYANVPTGSFRGSSREDSISSSMFGDSESIVADDVPVVIRRQGTGDWVDKGLGITNDEGLFDPKDNPLSPPAHLIHQISAPGQMQHVTSRTAIRQKRSSDKMRAKREIMEMHRHECGESGDDEDEELGDVAVKEKSPKSSKHPHRGSKLGTEMMRTNSRGSVVSTDELPSTSDLNAPPSIAEEDFPTSASLSLSPTTLPTASITPPEIFTSPGKSIANIEMDMDETPRPTMPHSRSSIDLDPTPRATSVTSGTSTPLYTGSTSPSHSNR